MTSPAPGTGRGATRRCQMTWTAQVYGDPTTKGNMKCVGARNGFHQLIDANRPRLAPWETAMIKAGQALAAIIPNPPLAGPVQVEATFTLARPKTVKRTHPIGRNDGDLDKYVRALLDALTKAGVWGDDTQCVRLITSKAYPDAGPDALPRPGVLFRVTPIDQEVTLC